MLGNVECVYMSLEVMISVKFKLLVGSLMANVLGDGPIEEQLVPWIMDSGPGLEHEHGGRAKNRAGWQF